MTLACVMAAVGVTRSTLSEQRIVIFGAGSAGLGVARQLRDGMVLLDGLAVPPDRVAVALETWTPEGPAAVPGPLVELPVVLDGEDLPDVARRWGCTRAEVRATLTTTTFTSAFCGFAPGFGYLTGLPEPLAVPRRATPRAAVPAGSVAVAGRYTGVYPGSSPGGWQLLGRTSVPLWDTAREPAALLAPGVRVRFTPIPGSAGA